MGSISAATTIGREFRHIDGALAARGYALEPRPGNLAMGRCHSCGVVWLRFSSRPGPRQGGDRHCPRCTRRLVVTNAAARPPVWRWIDEWPREAVERRAPAW